MVTITVMDLEANPKIMKMVEGGKKALEKSKLEGECVLLTDPKEIVSKFRTDIVPAVAIDDQLVMVGRYVSPSAMCGMLQREIMVQDWLEKREAKQKHREELDAAREERQKEKYLQAKRDRETGAGKPLAKPDTGKKWWQKIF